MRRLRPAVEETAYSGGLLAAAGIAVALLVEPTPRTGHLIGALILFALFTPVLVLPVYRLAGEHGLGRGWFDAANFVAAPTSKP